MKKIFLAFLCALFFTACDKPQSVSGFTPFQVGEKLVLQDVLNTQNITLVRVENGFVIEGEKRGILFDIFATFCPPCQKEAPHLMGFANANQEAFKLIGLITFEEVSNEYVVENFIKKYGGYYFISNSAQNARLIRQILRDISYTKSLQIPFKVVLKEGIYQPLTDNLEPKSTQKNLFWLGGVSVEMIAKDFRQIFKNISF